MSPPKSKQRDYFFGTSPDLPKIIEIDLDQIRLNPDQPRKTIDQRKLQELAASIERQGLIQPIVVKKLENEAAYILVAGERRFRAHQLLSKATIAAIITKGNPDEIALIENIQRENLNPLEEAEALQRMMERYQYTQEELGKVIGKAQNTISETLQINALPRVIKDDYQSSNTEIVSKSALIELSRIKDQHTQQALWIAMKQGRWSVREIRSAKAKTRGRSLSSQDKIVAAGHAFIKQVKAIETIDDSHYQELLNIGNILIEHIQRLKPI